MGSPTVRIKGFLKSKKRSAGGEFCGSRFCPETCCTVVCHLVHVCHTYNHPLILTLMLHNSLWHHTYLISLQSLALNKISSCGLTWALFSFQPCARFLSFYPCSPLSLYESQQLLCLVAPTPSQTSPIEMCREENLLIWVSSAAGHWAPIPSMATNTSCFPTQPPPSSSRISQLPLIIRVWELCGTISLSFELKKVEKFQPGANNKSE